MKNSNQYKLKLKIQLKQFGLNPSEWTLFESFEGTNSQVIFHHKEEALSLIGCIDFKKLRPHIKNLELMTI